jgi:hypothetical protein
MISALVYGGLSASNSQASAFPSLSEAEISVTEGIGKRSDIVHDQEVNQGITTMAYTSLCEQGPPYCVYSVEPGVVAGIEWGKASVSANPNTGSINLYTRAAHAVSGKMGWWVDFPLSNPFYYEPQTFGLSTASGYVRNTFQLVSTTGDVQPGTPVTVHTNIDLEGVFDDYPTSGIKLAVLTNKLEDAYWTESNHGINFGFIEDMGIPAWRFSTENSSETDISFSNQFDKQFEVGDLIVLEALFVGYSSLANIGDGRVDTFADFQSTLKTTLSVNTAGVSLKAVPLPAAFFTFNSALLGFAGLRSLARRRRI